MSSFGDIVNSIGDSSRPAQPSRPLALKPLATNAAAAATQSKSAPPTPSAAAPAKAVYKGTARTPIASQQSGNLKRKAEDISSERPVKLPKPDIASQRNSDRVGQKLTAKANNADTKSPSVSKPANGLPSAQSAQSAPSASKPPAKPLARGSYAEMMARAKEAAQSKTPSQLGMIKHQATEKAKPSKLADRRRAEQEKSKAEGVAHAGKTGPNGKVGSRRRSASPTKPTKKGDPNIARQPKAPQPPLHAPARPQAPAYKGTMGQDSKRSREEVQRKKSRYDEYLGTDEEEEDDYGYGGDEVDYYSDASSDMEGGFDDIEMEERVGLKVAKEDDARELALEAKLKKEKLERKQKLAALAAKRR